MKSKFKKQSNQRGVIAIITLLAVSTLALGIITTVSTLAIDELRITNSGGVVDQTYYAAESGLNEALYRLIDGSAPTAYSIVLDGITVDITVEADPDDSYSRIVRAQATDNQGKVRTVQVSASTSSFAAGFDYAIQGGSGGVYLDNNTTINGEVYSNGDILAASGGTTNHEIFGNVTGAASSTIESVEVTGSVLAGLILDADLITGDAFSKAIDSYSLSNLGGVWNEIDYDAPVRGFPITQADVDKWKAEEFVLPDDELATSPANCPEAYNDGSFYCVINNEVIGQKKITGNLYVGNGATLTLSSSFIWIQNDVIFDNNGTVEIDNSLCNGDSSVFVIVDGKVDVSNNYTFNGCVDDDGITVQGIVIISTRNEGVDPVLDEANPDIYASNNSDSIIFAAINGLLKVKNNGFLSAAAAHTLFLEPGSTVTFNPFLAEVFVGSGGGEEIGTALGSWQEL